MIADEHKGDRRETSGRRLSVWISKYYVKNQTFFTVNEIFLYFCRPHESFVLVFITFKLFSVPACEGGHVFFLDEWTHPHPLSVSEGSIMG